MQHPARVRPQPVEEKKPARPVEEKPARKTTPRKRGTRKAKAK